MLKRSKFVEEALKGWLVWHQRRVGHMYPLKTTEVLSKLTQHVRQMPQQGAGVERSMTCMHLAILGQPEYRLVPLFAVYLDYRPPKPKGGYMSIKDLSKESGISRDTFYRWGHETAIDVVQQCMRFEKCQIDADNII